MVTDGFTLLGDDQLFSAHCRRSSGSVVLGSNVMFSGTMRALESGIGVDIAVTGISELDPGDIGRDRQMIGGLVAPFGGLAHARDHFVVGC